MSYWFCSARCFLAANPGACCYSRIWRFGISSPCSGAKLANRKLRQADRFLWLALRRWWPDWQKGLLLFQPQTVIAWHRLGFRLFWRWKSRACGGRPTADRKLINLIRRMWSSNPTWGSKRIQAELAKLGIEVSDTNGP